MHSSNTFYFPRGIPLNFFVKFTFFVEQIRRLNTYSSKFLSFKKKTATPHPREIFIKQISRDYLDQILTSVLESQASYDRAQPQAKWCQ